MQTPPESKVKIEDLGQSLKITVPNRLGCAGWFIAAFLGVWLIGWFAGEVSALKQLMGGKAPLPVLLFMGVWLIGWTIGGAFAISFFFFVLMGKEIVTADSSNLKISYGVGPFALGKNYPLGEVKNLGVGNLVPLVEKDGDEKPSPALSNTLKDRIKDLEQPLEPAPRITAAPLHPAFGAGLMMGAGLIFNYRGKIIRFARTLSPEEAEYLLEMLKLRGYAN